MSRSVIRCTVESMNYSACGLQIGDSFEVDEDGLVVHAPEGFCLSLIHISEPTRPY